MTTKKANDVKEAKEAKEAFGYTPEPILKACKNCASFAVDVYLTLRAQRYNKTCAEKDRLRGIDKNARCVTGGFPVKKMGSCDNWKAKG